MRAVSLDLEFIRDGGKEMSLVAHRDWDLTLHLESHEDLVSRQITPISPIIAPIIPVINLLTKSP